MSQEQRELHLKEEMQKKDEMLELLYSEIASLEQQLRQVEASARSAPTIHGTDITHKLMLLEREVSARKTEVEMLKEKACFLNSLGFHCILYAI